jgi:hypothetical protein
VLGRRAAAGIRGPPGRRAGGATGQDHTWAGLLQAGLDLPGGAGFGSTLIRLVRL